MFRIGASKGRQDLFNVEIEIPGAQIIDKVKAVAAVAKIGTKVAAGSAYGLLKPIADSNGSGIMAQILQKPARIACGFIEQKILSRREVMMANLASAAVGFFSGISSLLSDPNMFMPIPGRDLCVAAEKGDLAKVRELLDQEGPIANLNESLYLAALNGYAEVISALLEKGAQINASEFGVKIEIPLEHSTESLEHSTESSEDSTEPASDLMFRLADLVRRIESGEDITESGEDITESGEDITELPETSVFKTSDTPLCAAARQGHVDVANVLLDKGALVEGLDGEGNTPLMIAAKYGQSEMVKMLIAKGAADTSGVAMNIAKTYSNVEVVRALTGNTVTERLQTWGWMLKKAIRPLA